jgi:hypothetical protein
VSQVAKAKKININVPVWKKMFPSNVNKKIIHIFNVLWKVNDVGWQKY